MRRFDSAYDARGALLTMVEFQYPKTLSLFRSSLAPDRLILKLTNFSFRANAPLSITLLFLIIKISKPHIGLLVSDFPTLRSHKATPLS